MDTAEDRQRWLSLLNRATREQLDAAWDALPLPHPDYILLKRPETGLVMAQGRAGGDGRRFNLGEISVTRAVAGLGEFIGQGYVLGRDHRRAELVAVFDALLQAGRHRDHIVTQLLEPVRESLHRRDEEDRRKADATRVEFFTLARESQ
ncbi:MAG: phosphonate C-P lyase system protein PhnG [Acidihalobacter sp.]